MAKSKFKIVFVKGEPREVEADRFQIVSKYADWGEFTDGQGIVLALRMTDVATIERVA